MTDKSVELIPIISGDTWKYTNPTPTNGKTGDEYVVTGKPLTKLGVGKVWTPCVLYVRLSPEGHVAADNEPIMFCRDEEHFRKNFEKVPK